MFESPRDVLDHIKSNEIEFLDLVYVNLLGGTHHVTLPASAVSDRTLVEGVGVDGSSIPGFKSLESGDVSVVPDLTTVFADPFAKHPSLVAFCDIVEADSKAPVPNSPRGVARKAEAWLASTGLATTSRWGPEFEYYVFDACTVDNGPMASGYRIRSEETEGADGLGFVRHQKGYHASRPNDRLHELRCETVRRLELAGVPVAYHHHEVGAAGQMEIEIVFADLLRAGDTVVKGKMIARLTAREFGMIATFMPKPLHGHAGSGMHFHQHLFLDREPLFYEAGPYADLSAFARAYVAGLLDHGSALLAFTNPSTNSYRRLVPGFEAPIKAFYSLANRSAAIRVPRYARSPEQKRIEFRPPDASCNPYLAMSAMLMAGIDGVRRRLDPTALGFGPFDANVEKLPVAEQNAIRSLPTSLGAALDALRADHRFLLEGGVFTGDLVDTWVQILGHHAGSIAQRPHPYEFELYLDC